MTQMLVYDCLVTLCCGRMEVLLMYTQHAHVEDDLAPSRLNIYIEDEDGYALSTNIFYCPYCGKRIVVKQAEEE